MHVYQFRMWGRYFAVDVKSGNFFEVDKIASQAISLLEHNTEEKSRTKLVTLYGVKAVNPVFKKIADFKKKMALFSKRQPKNATLERRITDLTLNIVKGCNLRCRYCWNKAGVYGSPFDRNGKMDFLVAAKAVDLLIKESQGAKDLVIDFYGGEPLLNFDLIKKTIEYCRSIQGKRKINFRFLLATNGTLLAKDKAEFLIENNVDIAVSIDGAKKVQDAQRPFSDGAGSFDTITDNLNSIDSYNRRKIVGRATFTPYSQDVIKTFKFLRDIGLERIEICESENAGYGLESRGNFFFSGLEGIKRLKSIYYKLAKFYTAEIIRGSLTYENTYFNRFFKQLSRLYHIQSIVGTCSAGFSLMAVDMDGSIYPCTAFVGVPEFKVGTASQGIDAAKLSSFLSTKIDANNACSGCWAKRICRGCGSCYNLNYFTNKTLGKPDPYYCELFRYKTKLMIAMIAEVFRKNPQHLEEVLVPEYYVRRGRKIDNAN